MLSVTCLMFTVTDVAVFIFKIVIYMWVLLDFNSVLMILTSVLEEVFFLIKNF